MGTSLDALRNPRLFISLLVNRTFLNTQISLDVYPYQPYNPYRRCAKGTEWQGEQQVKKDDEAWRYIRLSDFSGLSVSFPVPRKRDLAHTYRTHNPSKSRGSNGRRTEHQIGEGFTEIDTRALVAMITTSYQKIQQKSGSFQLSASWDFPFSGSFVVQFFIQIF